MAHHSPHPPSSVHRPPVVCTLTVCVLLFTGRMATQAGSHPSPPPTPHPPSSRRTGRMAKQAGGESDDRLPHGRRGANHGRSTGVSGALVRAWSSKRVVWTLQSAQTLDATIECGLGCLVSFTCIDAHSGCSGSAWSGIYILYG